MTLWSYVLAQENNTTPIFSMGDFCYTFKIPIDEYQYPLCSQVSCPLGGKFYGTQLMDNFKLCLPDEVMAGTAETTMNECHCKITIKDQGIEV